MYSIWMPLVLIRPFNKANIQLTQDTTGQTVGVLQDDGGYRYYPWRGFMDSGLAEGKPVVALNVTRVGRCDASGWGTDWTHIRSGHIQGVLMPGGAYAVIDESIRVI